MTKKVSHQTKQVQIIVLHILILTLLEMRNEDKF